MDLEEVKACLRGLLSSSPVSYNLDGLLRDFRYMTGNDLPLFGCLHPVEFLRTLDDTVQLFGNPYNPELALVQSQKSAHIISLVDRQKNTLKTKCARFLANKPKRLIIPNQRNDAWSQSSQTISSDTSETSAVPFEIKPKLPETDFNRGAKSVKPYATPKRNTSSPSDSNDSSIERSPSSSLDKLRSDKSQVEDVSDSESCFSVEDYRSSSGCAFSTSYCSVNEGIRNKLKKMIKNYPKGLWCCELPGLFQEEYNFALEYREFGYTSLIQMLSELPDVFRCVRPGNEDWILFDASVAPSPEEKKMMSLQAASDLSCEVTMNVKKLLFNCFENSTDSGIEIDEMLELYKKAFGCPLDFQSLGFKDLKSFLKTWEGSLFSLLEIGGKTYVVPPLKITVHSPIQWEEALPPITAENDIFAEIFPKDVVGPEEGLLELDLTRHVAVGNVVKVTVAEVWSPGQFYVQLNKFKSRLSLFMDDLQKFYDVHLKKYKMPDSTIRPKQVCVGLYTADPEMLDEWHRAQIVKVINEKIVLVNLVDYGTVTRMKKTQLRFLHRCFQSFPVQGFLAGLSGIAPADGSAKWPMSTSKKFLELVRVSYLDAELVDIDFKKPFLSVVLFDPFQKSGVSINQKLVLEKLALQVPGVEEPRSPIRKPESQTRAFGDIPSHVSVRETLNKNLSQITDEFSDIVDLGHTTLIHKMRSLKIHDIMPSKKRVSEPLENLTYEFEEVPDLELNTTKSAPEPGREEKGTGKVFEDSTPGFSSTSVVPGLRSAAKGNSNGNAPPLSVKPKRLPPGLEHVNVLPNFNQIQSLLQPDDLKKKKNILVMELLATNPSIKQVGANDPDLAMKIASEMAEASLRSGNPCCGLDPLVNKDLAGALLPAPPAPDQLQEVYDLISSPVLPPNSSGTAKPSVHTLTSLQDISARKCEESCEYVKETKILEKIVHRVTIDGEVYFWVDEIVRNFTLISNREIAKKVLQIQKICTDYRIITKATDENVFSEIKKMLPLVKKKSKKIYLIPSAKVVPFLNALGYRTKAFETQLSELQLTKGNQTKA